MWLQTSLTSLCLVLFHLFPNSKKVLALNKTILSCPSLLPLYMDCRAILDKPPYSKLVF